MHSKYLECELNKYSVVCTCCVKKYCNCIVTITSFIQWLAHVSHADTVCNSYIYIVTLGSLNLVQFAM